MGGPVGAGRPRSAGCAGFMSPVGVDAADSIERTTAECRGDQQDTCYTPGDDVPAARKYMDIGQYKDDDGKHQAKGPIVFANILFHII